MMTDKLTTISILSLTIVFIFTFIWIVKRNKSVNVEIIPSLVIKKEMDKTTPDLPLGFGYKISWMAVKTKNIQMLSQLLKLKKTSICNWKYGINAAYENSIFITPSIDGWALVCGNELPDGDSNEIQEILITLSKEFHEAQFFSTHRVTEYHCWIKAVEGKVIRIYSYVGESGENISVNGKLTDFEKKFNLINTFSKEAEDSNYFDREDLTIPDEELVMQIAGNWSLNPTTLNERADLPLSLGILGKR